MVSLKMRCKFFVYIDGKYISLLDDNNVNDRDEECSDREILIVLLFVFDYFKKTFGGREDISLKVCTVAIPFKSIFVLTH